METSYEFYLELKDLWDESPKSVETDEERIAREDRETDRRGGYGKN